MVPESHRIDPPAAELADYDRTARGRTVHSILPAPLRPRSTARAAPGCPMNHNEGTPFVFGGLKMARARSAQYSLVTGQGGYIVIHPRTVAELNGGLAEVLMMHATNGSHGPRRAR